DAAVAGSTTLLDPHGAAGSVYRVQAITPDGAFWATEEFTPWAQNHLDVPLEVPEGGVTPDGVAYEYRASDASVGDLDGDGRLEIVLLWHPTNAKDNSQSGHTGNVYVDAYTLDGEQLWRIVLGRNIRAGAHYTQLMVFDLDSDGRAEVAVKTADGTVDGVGTVIGDPEADWRNEAGYVLDGPELLTVFDGLTGAAIDTVDYVPPRGVVDDWGDGYGNRVDRFLAAVAYLDGEHPSVVFTRGYYTRAVLAAWDFDGERLALRWVFDSDEPGNEAAAGQGNHNLSVADVDGDHRDEIVFGSATIDDRRRRHARVRDRPRSRRRHARERPGAEQRRPRGVRRPRVHGLLERPRRDDARRRHRRDPVEHPGHPRHRPRRRRRHRPALPRCRGLRRRLGRV